MTPPDPGQGDPTDRIRVLLIAPDTAATAISAACRACAAPVTERIDSIGDLYASDLASVDLVLCALHLRDADALDALAYLRGARPNLPVLVFMTAADAAPAAEAIRAGAADVIIIDPEAVLHLDIKIAKALEHHRIVQENGRLHQELSRSLADLAVRNQQLQEMIDRLERTARTDELTGLANRRWLNLMIEGHFAEAARYDLPLTVMMIDLDGFKAVNDAHGHQRGDTVLREAAQLIAQNCREVDVCARFGGDEFCILMPHTDAREAETVARRIHAAFNTSQAEAAPTVGMSIGIAGNIQTDATSVSDLIVAADTALYQAKASGKGCICIADELGPQQAA